MESVLPVQLLISIVDDDQSFRESLRRLLRSLGYAVATFPSAAEFLASPNLADTDCLVVDVHMPEMTGIELFGHMMATGCAIPTILVTAYPDSDAQERLLAAGASFYLPKPLEEAHLIGCLRSAVALGKSPR